MTKLLLIISAILFLNCSGDERQKPKNVSQNAVWKGGVDGGCWIDFKMISADSIEATIFDENGEFWKKGIFKMNGSCEFAKSKVIEEITGFDGESLLTNKQCSFRM